MELSLIRKHGLQYATTLKGYIHDALSGADKSRSVLTLIRTRCTDVMRPSVQKLLELVVRVLDGPADRVVDFGLRLWIASLLLRHGVTTLFLLLRLLRKSVTTVLSVGTGSSRSVSRKDAWRYAVPVREVALAPLHTFQFITYNAEIFGQLVTASGLLINAMTDKKTNMLIYLLQKLARSVLTLGPLRMVVQYPVECLFLGPLIWAWLKYRAVVPLSRAKVSVTQVTNVYMGGEKKKVTTDVDFLLIAHTTLKLTGLPWLSSVFLCYRSSIIENGFLPTMRSFKEELKFWWTSQSFWSQLLTRAFEFATLPLALCASLIAGTQRASFVPALTPNVVQTQNLRLPVVEVHPGLGFEPPQAPRNALVEVFRFPHGVGLELFTSGGTTLLGGDALREIAVVATPRLTVKIPLKPVTNNTFAFDLLAQVGDCDLRRQLEKLTKVPANPYRNAVEVQKFVTANIDPDFDTLTRSGMTFRQFAILGLRQAYDIRRHGPKDIGELTTEASMADYLTAETAKHHPGWTTRAFGGQTKGDAWAYSLARAVALFTAIVGGQSSLLKAHVWLFLGVVKKQAERKNNDEEYRSRGAVIPEQELQLIWTHLMKPLTLLLEDGLGSWAPHFELFHGKLFNVWGKFAAARDCVFVNEDMRDHGASLEWPVASLIAEFYGSLITIRGNRTTEVFRALFSEMIYACVGLPDTEGAVHILKTTRGMKDGVFGTSVIGGTYKILGELYKVWKAWHASPAAQAAWPDPLAIVSVIRAEIHGDNSLAAYPAATIPWMSGVQADVAKTVREIGLVVKSEESLETIDLGQAFCMSWHMSNVGTVARPIIVGWKNTADVLKGFFLPERLTNFDVIGDTTRAYLGQILISLYILGFWNGEARLFIESAWRALWMGQPEEAITITKVSDFVYKTGLDPEKIMPVSSMAETPYPPTDVVKLWVGHSIDRLVGVTAPGAPTLADGARLCHNIWSLKESAQFPTPLTHAAPVPLADYDAEGMEGAGVFGRRAPESGHLPGGQPFAPHALTVAVLGAFFSSTYIRFYFDLFQRKLKRDRPTLFVLLKNMSAIVGGSLLGVVCVFLWNNAYCFLTNDYTAT